MVPPVPADLLEIAEALVPGAPVGLPRGGICTALVATWHGWDVLRAATDEETCRRARAWNDPIGVEHLHPLFASKPLTSIDGFVRAVVTWLETHR